MTEYNNDNRGAIWKNEKKATDRHPDFTGKATIDGVDYYVSAWKRGPDDNPKAPALRFTVTPVADVAQKGIQQAKQVMQAEDDFEGDSIPF
jgi:hypothetical protein